jgi:WD40 repeat protein
MSGHDGFVNAIRFTRDSHQLVTASVDGTNRIWDVNSGKMLQVLHGHTGSVISIELGNDHQHLVSAGRDQQLRVWDLSAIYGGRSAIRIEQGGTYSTTFSPDGSRLFIACFDGHVRILDTLSGKLLHKWKAHESSCNSLSLNRDGTRLLTCSWDKTAKLWDTSDLSLVATFDCQKGVTHCALSPDGTLVALAVEKDLQIWDVERRERSGLCEGHDESLIELVFSPDGESVATSAQSGPARIWNVKTNELVGTLGEPAERATTVVYSNDGSSVATGKTGNVSVWDAGNFQLKYSIEIGSRPVSRLALARYDTRLAVGSDTVSIVDPEQGTHLLRFQPNDDTIYFLAFSPDGSRLASCTTLGSVAISETKPLSQRLSHIRTQERKK